MIPSIEIGLTGGVGLRVRTAAILLIASTACAQGPTPPPLVAHETASEAMSPDPVSPNRVSTENTGTLQSPLEIPPLPKGKATLLGGTIASVDHVRDRLVLQIFGGGNTSVLFDERTRVFRDGRTASTDDLKSGLRAYVDTTLDGTKIFAKNIRVVPSAPAGQSSGQIVAFEWPRAGLPLNFQPQHHIEQQVAQS